ncbi:MAG: hypothetical protein ABJD11_09550 [Gemmatimonadota bacterium]
MRRTSLTCSRSHISVLCLALCLSSSKLLAQKVFLSPNLGLYIPTDVTFKDNNLRIKQKVGVTMGLALGVRFGERLGISTGVKYIPSNVTIANQANGVSATENAHVFTANTAMNFWIFPRRHKLAWVLRAGVGLVARGGTAYNNVQGRTDLAGVAGATIRLRLNRFLAFEGGVEDYLYRANLNPGRISNGRFQQDIHFSFGIGIPILGLTM